VEQGQGGSEWSVSVVGQEWGRGRARPLTGLCLDLCRKLQRTTVVVLTVLYVVSK